MKNVLLWIIAVALVGGLIWLIWNYLWWVIGSVLVGMYVLKEVFR